MEVDREDTKEITASEQSEAVSSKNGGSETGSLFKAALSIFAFDVGLSTALGFIVGVIYAVVKQTEDMTGLMVPAMVIGIGLSVYAAYILRVNYSKDSKAVVYLICLGLLFGVLSTIVEPESDLGDKKNLSVFAATVIAYVVGWLIADRKLVSLPIVPAGWQKVFRIIGYIVIALSLLGILVTVFGG